MTQYTAIWIRCPKCWNATIVSSNLINDIDNYTSICKCGINTTEVAKQAIEDYCRFASITAMLEQQFIEDDKTRSLISELYDLYSKVVIG